MLSTAPIPGLREATAKRAVGVGTQMQLTVRHDGDYHTAVVTLLGHKADRFLLFELPSVDGRTVEPPVSSRCIARYLEGDRVMGFSTTVLHTQLTPDNLLFVAQPERIQEFARRREDRVRINLRGVLRLDEDRREMVQIRDISSGGCGMRVTNPTYHVEAGTTVEVMVQLPGEQRFTPVRGIVRQCKPLTGDGDDVRWIGVQFEFDLTNDHIRERIQRLTEAPSAQLSLSDL
ncbi:MAG: flagellar brake protein [Deltaproteobacteria bacterium]